MQTYHVVRTIPNIPCTTHVSETLVKNHWDWKKMLGLDNITSTRVYEKDGRISHAYIFLLKFLFLFGLTSTCNTDLLSLIHI